MTEIEQFANLIKTSQKIVFFGGAGVSTESGVKDYRSADGIYNTAKNYGMPPEEILSDTCFWQNPEIFYKFFRDYFLEDVKPNTTHYALAELESMGKDITVVTQNIDGLHQLAGSKKVYELHGTTSKFYCPSCGKKYGLDYLKNSKELIPHCDCGKIIKPYVVLYGEPLDEKTVINAVKAISNADLLIIGGTSLAVQPAASFVSYFGGDNIVIINKQSTPYDRYATLTFHTSLGEVFSKTMEILR